MKYEKETGIALDLATIAAAEIRKRYYGGAQSWMKENQTPVTEADLASNKIIMEGLQREFPSYGMVSEECDEVKSNSDMTWYIDPLDGTKSFIRRTDNFTIMIGLAKKGKPVMGVVYKPLSKEAYIGVVGEGAWRTNPDNLTRNSIRVSENKELFPVIDSSSDSIEQQKSTLYQLGLKSYMFCSGEGSRIMKIAEGIANLRVNSTNSNTWDVCAPMAILEAAGGFYAYQCLDEAILMNGKGTIKDKVVFAANDDILKYVKEKLAPWPAETIRKFNEGKYI
jgi:3'(2'), 5'-bisphosphate nucleotidase